MPSDAEYLLEAGLNADGSPVSDEAPATQQVTTEPVAQTQTIEELIFESGGKQFKVPANAELALKHAGQTVRKPLNTIINGWRQVGDYNSKLAEIDRRNKEYETNSQALDKFRQLEEWSRENPELFEHVWNGYTNRDKLAIQQQLGTINQQAQDNGNGAANLDPRVVKMFEDMSSQIKGLLSDKEMREKEQEEKAIEADISFINTQIEDFQKYLDSNFAHANIKLENEDENGISLKAKIIKFGIDSKLPDFETAALKYLKDTLIFKAAEKARIDAVKNVKQQNRSGLIATSSTPFPNGQSDRVESVKGKSYEQIASEAKRELAGESV